MMKRLGFNNKWILWIKSCIESATVLVLVNGSPTKQFKMKKGLRQGDPLAPFLFIIVVEGLAGLVRAALSKGFLEGIKVGYKGVEINLLQFADDTLFFCQPNLKTIFTIKVVLRCFEIVSGLKVNFHKSFFGSIGICSEDVSIFFKCLNCMQMGVPFRYLGMPIGGNQRSLSFWGLVVAKIRSKLSSWKGRLLFKTGRMCLTKSVLNALPLFHF